MRAEGGMTGAMVDVDQELLLTSSSCPISCLAGPVPLSSCCIHQKGHQKCCVAIAELTRALTRAQEEQSLLVSSRSFQVSMMSEAEEKLQQAFWDRGGRFKLSSALRWVTCGHEMSLCCAKLRPLTAALS